MSASDGISDLAQSVRSSKAALQQKYGVYDRAAATLSSNWKGVAGEAFRNSSRRIHSEIIKYMNNYVNLSTKLSRLSNSIRRSEAEDAAAAARAATQNTLRFKFH